MNDNLFKKSRRNDRIAEFLIKAGGILVIVAVVWILVMIARVAIPLFYASDAALTAAFKLPSRPALASPLAFGIDESGKEIYLLGRDGEFHFINTATGLPAGSLKTLSPDAGGGKSIVSVETSGKSGYNLLWSDGTITSAYLLFKAQDGQVSGTGIIHDLVPGEATFPATEGVIESMARMNGESGIRVDRLSLRKFRANWITVEKDILGNEKRSETGANLGADIRENVTAAVLDHAGHYLYLGNDKGELLRFDLSEPGAPKLLETVRVNNDKSPVTALNLASGDTTVVICDKKGNCNGWFPVTAPGAAEYKRLQLIHPLPPHDGSVTSIIASPRDRIVVSTDEKGVINIDHLTSEKRLLTLESGGSEVKLALSERGNMLCAIDESGNVKIWRMNLRHPEVTSGTLFSKIWYEGYDKPEHVWQSSSANDDYEPKLGLVPLIFGTLKATFFAMIFAVPLALLGALYTSQFISYRLKVRIKPAVEIMAAIPSVVIGFLGGLWLAPLLEKGLFPFFLSLIILPLLLFVAIFFYRAVKPSSRLGCMIRGREFLLIIPLILAGIWISHSAGTMIEARLFAGDFKQWLFNAHSIRYEQRNAFIIGIALGFAVIPIIFTIAEDALSNVPRNLSAASLALGASRWQTAWRVVLPSALPGVFSAIMIGFGRAVGETMIVLMATGNTPIISFSAFNGLRSLAANIAVEIPEAPLDSSLYRVLFLSAVLLFLFTFIINSAAEVLRQRFRKKYGRY